VDAPPRDGPTPTGRILAGAVAALAGATLALLLVSLVLPARALFALHWYSVGCATIVVVSGIRLLIARRAVLWHPNREFKAAQMASPPDLPARLRTIVALVSRANWDAAGFEHELRPILRAIARQRLAAQGTVGLDGGAGRAWLGEAGIALLRPGERTAGGEHGVSIDTLRDAVERLEQRHAVAVD
jgi:hypothetical protein